MRVKLKWLEKLMLLLLIRDFLGGYGTVEEVLEMIIWSQLGIHKESIGLLNVDGYYNSLLALFDNGVEEGFIKPSARHIILFASTAKVKDGGIGPTSLSR